MPITMTSIAQLAGVSQPTVSDVLNGRWQAKHISPQTSERILKIAREHHYRPNRLARSLRTKHSQTIALVVPSLADAFFPKVIAGVEEKAKHNGYHMLLSHVPNSSMEAAEIDLLLEYQVDGLIIAPGWFHRQNREKYDQLAKEKTPFIFVNDSFGGMPCSAVVADDWTGGYEATKHLIQLKHKQIAHLAGDSATSTTTVSQLRTDGYRQALAEHHIQIPEGYIQMCDFSFDAALVATRRLLAMRNPPTAVFAANDRMALGGIKAAFELGLRVPQDISFVGFSDHLEYVWFHQFGLTTIRTDPEQMGREALGYLLKEIQHPGQRKRRMKLPVKLVVRDSTAAPTTRVKHT